MTDVRPIDANALIKTLLAYPIVSGGVLQDIREQPTLDYAPVRHGEWVAMVFTDTGKSAGYKCSECGLGARKKFAYCHCGAKMDGGKGNDQP